MRELLTFEACYYRDNFSLFPERRRSLMSPPWPGRSSRSKRGSGDNDNNDIHSNDDGDGGTSGRRPSWLQTGSGEWNTRSRRRIARLSDKTSETRCRDIYNVRWRRKVYCFPFTIYSHVILFWEWQNVRRQTDEKTFHFSENMKGPFCSSQWINRIIFPYYWLLT